MLFRKVFWYGLLVAVVLLVVLGVCTVFGGDFDLVGRTFLTVVVTFGAMLLALPSIRLFELQGWSLQVANPIPILFSGLNILATTALLLISFVYLWLPEVYQPDERVIGCVAASAAWSFHATVCLRERFSMRLLCVYYAMLGLTLTLLGYVIMIIFGQEPRNLTTLTVSSIYVAGFTLVMFPVQWLDHEHLRSKYEKWLWGSIVVIVLACVTGSVCVAQRYLPEILVRVTAFGLTVACCVVLVALPRRVLTSRGNTAPLVWLNGVAQLVCTCLIVSGPIFELHQATRVVVSSIMVSMWTLHLAVIALPELTPAMKWLPVITAGISSFLLFFGLEMCWESDWLAGFLGIEVVALLSVLVTGGTLAILILGRLRALGSKQCRVESVV